MGGLPVPPMRKLMPFSGTPRAASSPAVLLESSDFERSDKTEVLCIMCSLLFSKEVSHSWFT